MVSDSLFSPIDLSVLLVLQLQKYGLFVSTASHMSVTYYLPPEPFINRVYKFQRFYYLWFMHQPKLCLYDAIAHSLNSYLVELYVYLKCYSHCNEIQVYLAKSYLAKSFHTLWSLFLED